MPKYTVSRACWFNIEIEAENGEAAVAKANDLDLDCWDSTWDDETFYVNEDDESDEGEV